LKQSKEILEKKSPEASSKSSTFGRQAQKKGARSAKTDLTDHGTGLTGHYGNYVKISKDKKKGRPSFKELLAKWPNMREKELLRNRRSSTEKLMI
jgi:hypothetical protein